MRSSLVLALSALLGLATAMTATTTTTTTTTTTPVPPLTKDHVVTVTLLLPHCEDSRAQLEAALYDVSTPGGSQYMQHTNMRHLAKPCPETVEAVTAWTADMGFPSTAVTVSPHEDVVSIATTVAGAEAAFNTAVKATWHPDIHEAMVVHHDVKLTSDHALHGVVLPKVRVRASHVVNTDAATDRPAVSQPALTPDAAVNMKLYSTKEEALQYGATPRYPFSFWPPPAVYAIQAAQDSIAVVMFSTCLKSPWTPANVPLPAGETPNMPFDPQYPCSDPASIDSISNLVFKSQVSGQADIPAEVVRMGKGYTYLGVPSVDPDTSDPPCSVYVNNIEFFILQLEIRPASPLVDYVPYTLTGTEVFSDGSTVDFSHSSNGLPLGYVVTPLVTAETLRARYGIAADAAACSPDTEQAIGVPQPATSGFYSPSDLKRFYSSNDISTGNTCALKFQSSLSLDPSAGAAYSSVGMSSATSSVSNNPKLPGDETSLDVQWITAVAPGALTTVWHGGFHTYTAPTGYQQCWGSDALIDVALQIQYTKTPPKVISLSYGWPDIDFGETVFLDTHFMALGVEGTSVIVASGDSGTKDADFGYHGDVCDRFTPVYPASSPYVTTVGATSRLMNAQGSIQESVCSTSTGALITSGGGFASLQDMPDYQKATVQTYLANNPDSLPPSNMYNASKRAYPDVSLAGHNFGVVLKGQTLPVDGTSASSPSFAGMVTLLNDVLARMHAAGTSNATSLGFLNPKLYVNPGAFDDVTAGDNLCAGGGPLPSLCCPDGGFKAVEGWDAVSGLGTPNLQRLADALLPTGWSTTGLGTTACATDAAACAGSSGGGLSGGAIAGITIGVIIALVAIGAGVFIFLRRREPSIDPSTPSPFQVRGSAYEALTGENQP